MSDESGITGHTRSVVVTTICCLAGIAAGVVSAMYLGTSPEVAADPTMAVVVMGAFVIAQFPLYKVVGVDISEFGIKDNLYVTFMTFTLWFITYTVLLTAEVQF